MLHTKYSSSTSSKKRSRRVKEESILSKLDDIQTRSGADDFTKKVNELLSQEPVEKSDEEIQRIFNLANSELLKKFHEMKVLGKEQTQSVQGVTDSEEAGAVAEGETSETIPQRKRSRKKVPEQQFLKFQGKAEHAHSTRSFMTDSIEPLSFSDRLFHEPMRLNRDDAQQIQERLDSDSPDDKDKKS